MNNRTIKFRIWDNRWNNWVGDFEAKFLNNEEYTVQQFTGISGGNNKEIYEGDIVFHQGVIAEVIFSEGAFWTECISGEGANIGEITLLCIHELLWKVIGNIFQNPELLKN